MNPEISNIPKSKLTSMICDLADRRVEISEKMILLYLFIKEKDAHEKGVDVEKTSSEEIGDFLADPKGYVGCGEKEADGLIETPHDNS